jgi:hypothetical protein
MLRGGRQDGIAAATDEDDEGIEMGRMHNLEWNGEELMADGCVLPGTRISSLWGWGLLGLSGTCRDAPYPSCLDVVVGVRANARVVSSSAKDQLTGQSVAVKKIMKPFSTPVLSKRTYRELKLLKHLKHENVSYTSGWGLTRVDT